MCVCGIFKIFHLNQLNTTTDVEMDVSNLEEMECTRVVQAIQTDRSRNKTCK